MTKERNDGGMSFGGKVLVGVIIVVLIIMAWMCGAARTAHAVAGFFSWWGTFFSNLK